MADKAASPGLISRILPFVGRTNNKVIHIAAVPLLRGAISKKRRATLTFAQGEPPKKPTPAKLGEKNSMYFCEKRKRWIDPAADDGSNDDTNGPPPPPKTGAFTTAR